MAIGITLVTNCRKENNFIDFVPKSTINSNQEMIILGKKLQNPYSIENMQIAYNNIKDASHTEDDSLPITHYYVRYLPEDEIEFNILKSDSTLVLFDYPLDYEMSEGGISYHDPSLSDSVITWQYCVVENGYTYANVEYEILSSLFLLEGNSSESFSAELYRKIERESFRVTNNKYEINTTGNAESTPWNPKGIIQVHDDIAGGLIPLEGAKIITRNWFLIRTTYTAADGSYMLGNYWGSKVYYSIKWETYHYDIRDGITWQAYYNGPRQGGDWNLDILSGSSKSLRFATIHRAAHRYHYGNIGGLKRPGVWTNLKIAYLDKVGTGLNIGHYWQTSNPLFPITYAVAPNISIWGKSTLSNYWKTNDIYSVTIHELGHSSHINLVGLPSFILTKKIISESWANAVEWHITKIEYNELGYSNYADPVLTFSLGDYRDHMQNFKTPIPSTRDKDYNPIFIDIVDDFNQSIYKNETLPKCPNGGIWDGTNCYIETAPLERTPFFRGSYSLGHQFAYKSTFGCCTCPTANTSPINGDECWLNSIIPNTVVPFIVGKKMYYRPAGNTSYPYDEICGLSMGQLENWIGVYAIQDLDELESLVHNHTSSCVNPNAIKIFFDFYKNL